MDLNDSNNDGIPDIFENRRPITEILNDETPTANVSAMDGFAMRQNAYEFATSDFTGPVKIKVDHRTHFIETGRSGDHTTIWILPIRTNA